MEEKAQKYVDNYTLEGNAYLEDAQVVLNPGFCARICGSDSERKEKSQELYHKAANCYKMAKEFDKAADAYKKCAELESSESIAAGIYVEAALCMKKVNTSQAVKIMEQAATSYAEAGDFRFAAKYLRQVAEWYEEEYQYELAIEYYKKAADKADSGSYEDYVDQCLLKASDLMVLSNEDRFMDAIKEYERVATRYMKDQIGAARCIDKFKDEDPLFPESRELKLVTDIMKTMDNRDKDEFERILYHYNKLTPFDKLLTKILTRIKDRIPQEGLLAEGLS